MIATKDIQLYSGQAAPDARRPDQEHVPGPSGGNNFWPATYSVKTRLIYIPTATPCVVVTQDPGLSNKASDWKGGTYKQVERYESDLTVADPFTGEVKKTVHIPYPNYSGALSTAGGLVFTGYTDGTFAAYDDTTLDQLWKINVGVGFNAPPMTFEAGGKQYVAILAGLSADRAQQASADPRAQGPAQPDHAVRIRIVSAFPSPTSGRAASLLRVGWAKRSVPTSAVSRRTVRVGTALRTFSHPTCSRPLSLSLPGLTGRSSNP